MNIQRFTAPTSREALAKARLAFGDGTLILSNRPTENGVEVVATAEDALASLTQKSDSAGQKSSQRQPIVAAHFRAALRLPAKWKMTLHEMAMSTLSFQDYVRERMMRRRSESRPPASRASTPERTLQATCPRTHACHPCQSAPIESRCYVLDPCSAQTRTAAQTRAVASPINAI
jgi:flagellar biosynthesis protein FlhF